MRDLEIDPGRLLAWILILALALLAVLLPARQSHPEAAPRGAVAREQDTIPGRDHRAQALPPQPLTAELLP